jgi:hypothetical protein
MPFRVTRCADRDTIPSPYIEYVKCSKCSEPISLTDIVESSDGRLSHVDCKRPGVLTPEERALVFLYYADHVVAHCVPCNKTYRFTELASDLLGSMSGST